ncbi:MAG: hypothetical protein IKX10_00835 [Lachnospiraceae bacterium]|nr:hypothetical protein [Lachnospiraceae bacterium]
MKKRFAIIVILILTMSLFGCGDKKTPSEKDSTVASTAVNGKKIAEFKFVYGAPAYYIEYKVSFSDPVTVFIKESMPTDEPFGPVPGYYQGTYGLDEETASKITELYDKYELSKWNGFDEKSTITDGGGFELKITFKNGEALRAKGYSKYPDGYPDFYKELEEIFRSYRDRMIDEGSSET